MNTLPPAALPSAVTDLYPLEEFYGQRPGSAQIFQVEPASLDETAKRSPTLENHLLWAPVETAAVPEPFKSLLVHRVDMTSTLENFHKDKLRVELLGCHARGQEYYREVVLRTEKSGRRVEFGAIKIMLDLFPMDVRSEILREQQPLGRILVESGVEFSSQPRGYLRVAPDDFIAGALGLKRPQCLYGRRNTLMDPWERPLAEILEILPPA